MSSFTPPPDLPFAVVEAAFQAEEKCMAPVSVKWLKDITSSINAKNGQVLLKCKLYWPADDGKAYDMMIKHIEPNPQDSNTWLKAEADVTIFRFCSTFREAKEGVEDAAYLSSVGTQFELGKRVSRPNTKYLESQSEDELSPKKPKKGGRSLEKLKESVKPAIKPSTLNTAPGKKPVFSLAIGPSKHQNNGSAPSNQISKPGTSCTGDELMDMEEGISYLGAGQQTEPKGLLQQKPVEYEENLGGTSNDDFGDKLDDAIRCDEEEGGKINTSKESGDVPNCSPVGSPKPGPSNVPAPVRRQLWSTTPKKGRPSFSPGKQKNMLYSRSKEHSGVVTQVSLDRGLGVLDRKLDEVIARVNAIYLVSCPGAAAQTDENSDLPTLPLNSQEELENFEKFLSIEDQRISASIILAGAGGNDLKEIVFNTMKKLLTNKLAATINMEGRNRGSPDIPKTGLKRLQSFDIVHSAVKRRAKKLYKRTKNDCYEAEATNQIIGNWLKDAPKRLRVEEKKIKKNSSPEDGRLVDKAAD